MLIHSSIQREEKDRRKQKGGRAQCIAFACLHCMSGCVCAFVRDEDVLG